jgi:hypothetical protein
MPYSEARMRSLGRGTAACSSLALTLLAFVALGAACSSSSGGPGIPPAGGAAGGGGAGGGGAGGGPDGSATGPESAFTGSWSCQESLTLTYTGTPPLTTADTVAITITSPAAGKLVVAQGACMLDLVESAGVADLAGSETCTGVGAYDSTFTKYTLTSNAGALDLDEAVNFVPGPDAGDGINPGTGTATGTCTRM